MFSTPIEPSTDAPSTAAPRTEEREDLHTQARNRIEEMRAESALGNADPVGGVDSDPKQFTRESNA